MTLQLLQLNAGGQNNADHNTSVSGSTENGGTSGTGNATTASLILNLSQLQAATAAGHQSFFILQQNPSAAGLGNHQNTNLTLSQGSSVQGGQTMMTANSNQTPLTFIYGRATSTGDMGKNIATATAFLTSAPSSNAEQQQQHQLQQQFSSVNVEATNEEHQQQQLQFATLRTNNGAAHLNSLFAPANIKPTMMLPADAGSVKGEGEIEKELDEALVPLEQVGEMGEEDHNEEDVEMATVCTLPTARPRFNFGKCVCVSFCNTQ